jgi:hypothetical protein
MQFCGCSSSLLLQFDVKILQEEPYFVGPRDKGSQKSQTPAKKNSLVNKRNRNFIANFCE